MGRNSAKTPIKCTFLALFLPYTRSWGKTPQNGLKWAFFGPFWPPGAPPGGDPPLTRPGGAKNPPPEGGVGPWDPPGGGRNLASQPIFHREFAGGQVADQGDPLGEPLFGPFDPPQGGVPPPPDPPRGGVPPPQMAPQGPPDPSPRGVYPPPPKAPQAPVKWTLAGFPGV